MAFTLQNDTGTVVGANSYSDAPFFRAYHTDRGHDVTGFTDAAIQVALVLARDYMDLRHAYVGRRLNMTGQDTEWPRMWAWNDWPALITGIHVKIKQAQCEYAWRALTSATALMPDPTYDSTGRQIRSKSEEVGPVKETVEYEQGGYHMPTYPAADEILYSSGLAYRPSSGGISYGTVGRG